MVKKNSKTSASVKKPAQKSSTTSAPKEPRQVKDARYNSFKLQKKITQVGPALPSTFRLFRQSLGVLKRNWKLFGGIALWFGVINVVFVQGFGSGNDVTSAKSAYDAVFTGSFGHFISGIASYATLIGTSGQSSSTSTGSYEFIWLLVISLAFIWALREIYSGNKIRMRDAFYRGMYPLVTVVLVLLFIALQMIPFVAGGSIFSAVVANGIATTWVETGIWGFLFLLLAIWSIYMVSSSIFALYIVCLPDMTPRVALRSSKQLAANRRWTIIRKLLFLPIVLSALNFIVLLPFLMLFPPAAIWVFYVLAMVNIAVVHSYYYALYRSLL